MKVLAYRAQFRRARFGILACFAILLFVSFKSALAQSARTEGSGVAIGQILNSNVQIGLTAQEAAALSSANAKTQERIIQSAVSRINKEISSALKNALKDHQAQTVSVVAAGQFLAIVRGKEIPQSQWPEAFRELIKEYVVLGQRIGEAAASGGADKHILQKAEAARRGGNLIEAERLLETILDAARISEEFGGPDEAAAVLSAWQAPKAVREQLFSLIEKDERRQKKAVLTSWPNANGGLDSRTLIQTARMLRERLVRETDRSVARELSKGYSRIVAKLSVQAAIRVEANTLRQSISLGAKSSDIAFAYASVAERLSDQLAIQEATTLLRAHTELGTRTTTELSGAYVRLAVRLTDQASVAREAAGLRERFVAMTERRSDSQYLVKVYNEVIKNLKDELALEREMESLQASFVRGGDSWHESSLASAYAAAVATHSNQNYILHAAALLRERLSREYANMESWFPGTIQSAHEQLAEKLTDQKLIAKEVAALRAFITGATISEARARWDFAFTYANLVAKLEDQSIVRREVAALGEYLMINVENHISSALAFAYPRMVARLEDRSVTRQEVSGLAGALLRATDHGVASRLAQAYAPLAAKLSNESEVQAHAKALRLRLTVETDAGFALIFARAYVAVANKLTELPALRAEAAALGQRLPHRSKPDRASGFGLGPESIDPKLASALALAYSSVTAKLGDQTAIQEAASRVLEELDDGIFNEDSTPVFAQAFSMVGEKLTDQPIIVKGLVALLKKMNAPTLRPSNEMGKAYAKVAANLTDNSAILRAVGALRTVWSDPGAPGAYISLLDKLTDQAAVRSEAIALRNSWTSRAYTRVARKLTDQSTVDQEVSALREMLARATTPELASRAARAFGAVAAKALEDAVRRNDSARVEVMVREALELAGHPYLYDASDVLAALVPASGRRFGGDLGAAVDWWAREFRGSPDGLRPKQQQGGSNRDRLPTAEDLLRDV